MDAEEALRKWYALQEQQRKDEDEGNRLGRKADDAQIEIEAIENEWRDTWIANKMSYPTR